MAERRRRRRAVLWDLGRVISPLDVMYYVGNQISRRSLRYTLLTVGVSLLGMVATWLRLPGLTVEQAVLLPLVIAGMSLAAGTLLKIVPSLISSRRLAVAQASDLNLMEDYRKAQADEHLAALWDRVFQHEYRLPFAAGDDGLDGPVPSPADLREQFLERAHRALDVPLPQIQQMHALGLDLRYLEDWRDGAYLDRSDSKLREQFDGNATLMAARRATRLCGFIQTLRFQPRQACAKFWSAYIVRILAFEVAGAVERLNRDYRTDLFNCQALLWPGEEDADWLAGFDGAREVVLRRRRRIIRRVFGPDFETACEVLDHMLYARFAMATELRMRFDGDYCDGRLGYGVTADLTAEGRADADNRRAAVFAVSAGRDLAALDAYLRDTRPELFDPDDADALRAVRTAFHVDASGLKSAVLAAADGEPARVDDVIDDIVAATGIWTRRLLAVRVHHELTRLSRAGYRELIRRLGYADG